MPLDTTAEVITPEHVRFQHHVAGPSRRALAYALDLLIKVVVLVGLTVSFNVVADPRESDGTTSGFVLLVLFALEWGYYVAWELLDDGRTPGKRALGLRTVKVGGHPLGAADSMLRNLVRAADFLPFGYALGLISMAFDVRFRRLGDRVAGTMVVLEGRGELPAPLSLTPPATAAELAALPTRPRLSPWERDSLELFLRRTELGPARRSELAEMIAPGLARRLGVGVTDPLRFLGLVHHRLQPGSRPPEAR